MNNFVKPVEAAIVAHFQLTAVVICSCPAHIVLMVNILGGEAECPVCKQRWRMEKMSYEVVKEGDEYRGKMEYKIVATSSIVAPAGLSLVRPVN